MATTTSSSSPSWLTGLKDTLFQRSEKPPWLLRYRSNSAFICATVSIAVFTDIFLYAVIVPVMPYTLTEKTGISPDDVQHWNSVLIAVYGASLLAFSPICGWFADHTRSRRTPLLLGLVALAGATVMLNIGTSIGVLVAGRLLQGASAAVVWVVGLALLVDTVGRHGVGQAMGYVSMSMSLAVLLAPLLGGVVLDRGGYNAVFAMAYALIGLDVALRLVLIEKKVARRWERPEEVVDLAEASRKGGAGYGTAAAGAADKAAAAAATAATLEGADVVDDFDEKKSCGKKSSDLPPPPPPAADPAHVQDPEKISAAADTTAAPSRRPSTTASHRSLPTSPSQPQPPPQPPAASSRYRLPPTLSLLTSRRLSASLWGTLVVSILMSALDAVVPLYVRTTFHWSSTGAGLIFLPIVVPSFLAPVFGALADRAGPRYPTAAGFLGACPCYVLMRLVTGDTVRQKALLCALLALLGVALAAIMPCIMAEITYVVAAKERVRPGLFGAKGAYAQAYGLFNMAWAGGALVGPIWAGYVKDRAGWGTMGWSLGALSAVSAVPAALWCGGWIGGKDEGREEGGEDEERGV